MKDGLVKNGSKYSLLIEANKRQYLLPISFLVTRDEVKDAFKLHERTLLHGDAQEYLVHVLTTEGFKHFGWFKSYLTYNQDEKIFLRLLYRDQFFLKKIFCKHELKYLQTFGSDEFYTDEYVCVKCGFLYHS